MDFLEKIFGFISSRHSLKKNTHTFERSFFYNDVSDSVILLIQGIVTSENTVRVRTINRQLGVVLEDCYLLPESIDFFKEKNLNRQIFLQQALFAAGVKELKLYSLFQSPKQNFERALEILYYRNRVIEFIESKYPQYLMFYESLKMSFYGQFEFLDTPSDADIEWLSLESKLSDELQTQVALCKGDLKLAIQTIKKNLSSEKIKNLSTLPERALSLYCELMRKRVVFSGVSGDLEKYSNKNKKNASNARRPDQVESVDLEKEKKNENPVIHSFEKLETVDSYSGGFRQVDTSDQLDEHQDALKEIDLKHVTLGGQKAESVFNSDLSDLFDRETTILNESSSDSAILLPEWDYQKKSLKNDHCKLFVEQKNYDETLNTHSAFWYQSLMTKHRHTLNEWKRKLESIVNSRRWVDRQWDGAEISVDSYVRYLSDAKKSSNADARLYLCSKKQTREFTTAVLIDESMSTDSWVMNRRVLDVELDSIALMSYLVRNLNDPFLVCGTSSQTRNRCFFRIYKDFNNSWDSYLSAAPQIQPSGYTRLGPAIRFASQKIHRQGGGEKLLIILTDGKPTDYDRYEGRYGIEDIQHAILEAKQLGIHVRALAVEKDAKNYFPHLFGKNEYQIIFDPAHLPEALFKIYLEAVKS